MRDCTHQRFHEKLCSGRLDLLLENKSLLLVAAGSDELGYPLARGSKKTFVTAGGKPVIQVAL